MSEYLIHFDGSCPVNPGPKAGWGYAIHVNSFLSVSDSGLCTGMDVYSNNVAEFHALYEALKVMNNTVLSSSDKIFIRGDSALVVNILRGKWKAKGGLYYESYLLAQTELTKLRAKHITVSIDWIPREMNKTADSLSTENY